MEHSLEQLVSQVRTTDALAAVRRLSFAALDAATPCAIRDQLVSELFAVFGVDQVHVNIMARDGSLGRATQHRLDAGGTPQVELEYVLPLDRPSAVRTVMETGEPYNEPDAASASRMEANLVARF